MCVNKVTKFTGHRFKWTDERYIFGFTEKYTLVLTTKLYTAYKCIYEWIYYTHIYAGYS